MTPNYTCMRCGHTMFGLAEVEAHKCDPSVTTAETRAQIINGKFARRAAEASETPISRDTHGGFIRKPTPPERSKRDRINRLRQRINAVGWTEPQARNVLEIFKGILDLLEDEL